MRMIRTLAFGALTLALIGACSTGGGSTAASSAAVTQAPAAGETSPAATGAQTQEAPTGAESPSAGEGVTAEPGSPAGTEESANSAQAGSVRIGSAGFYESGLVAELYAQALEANGFTVERQFDIGARPQTFPALESGQFDLMPEYIGSLLEFVNEGAGEATADSEQTFETLQQRLTDRGLTALAYTPGQDKNGFVVRQDTAQEFGLSRMSDLAEVQTELTWGLPPECETNPLCGGALADAYGIDFDQIEITELAACDVPIATALNEGSIDVAELCTTQPAIAQFGFVLLEDDKGTQPAENIAPIVRDEWLRQARGVEAVSAILDPVSEALTTEVLTELGVQVAVEQRDREDVAREWLEENGLQR